MRRPWLIALLLLAGCAARSSETQMALLLDELTIVREELKKYPPRIQALEQQLRGQRRILQEEIKLLRREVARLEQRCGSGGEQASAPGGGVVVRTGRTVLRIGPDHWRVSRSALSRAELLRAARIVPAFKGGRAEGFKLYAIRPDGVLGQMGLKNGDTVLQVNGKPITTPSEALRVYTRLRHAQKLELTIRRRGRPMTLRYTLVP